MPEVFREGPYTIFFYAQDLLDEPPHVHVQRDRQRAKFWVAPVRLARNKGFAGHELRKVQRMIEERETEIMEEWNERSRHT